MTAMPRSMTARVVPVLAAVSCLLLFGSPATAEGGGRGGGEIVRAWKEAVIQVKVVLQVHLIVEGREVNKAENEIEAVGTVIDPGGLTVLSYSNIDPSRIFGDLMKRAKSGGEGAPDFDIRTEIGAVKMVLPEGNEIPAKIVLRDKDLDLAFVRPTEELPGPIPALDLSAASSPEPLDEVLILTRLGAVAGRIPAVSMYRIEGVIRKPRTYYVIDQNALTGRLGAPVFTMDGKVVGVFLLRVTGMHGAAAGSLDVMFGGAGRLGFYPVILPAEDVVAISRQAQGGAEGTKAETR